MTPSAYLCLLLALPVILCTITHFKIIYLSAFWPAVNDILDNSPERGFKKGGLEVMFLDVSALLPEKGKG